MINFISPPNRKQAINNDIVYLLFIYCKLFIFWITLIGIDKNKDLLVNKKS